jgi:hypothetical protein
MTRLRPILFPLVLALLAAANLAAQTHPRPRPMGIGPEVRVDTLPGDSFPGCPAIAVAPNGASQVIWAYPESAPYDVYARHFTPLLVPRNPEQVEIGPAGSASSFLAVYGVAADPGGFQTLTARVAHNALELFRRQLDSLGNPVSGLVQIGGADTLWAWLGPDGTVYTGTYLGAQKLLVVQQLLPDGKPAGPKITVNSRPIDAPGLQLVAAGGNGDFVAVWSGFNVARQPVNQRQVIRARVFRHNQPQGKDIDVNVTQASTSEGFTVFGSPAVAVNPVTHGFVVAWPVDKGSLSGTILGRSFDAQGRPTSPERVIFGDFSSFVTLAYDDAGNVLALWNTPLTPRSEILGRLFRSDLTPISIPFEPWSEASGDFDGPICAQAVWAGDSWRIAWTAETSKDGPRAVFVRRFTRGTPGS